MQNALEKKAREILALADVQVNGSRPWDIYIHNNQTFGRVLRQGSLGLGESYMDGWWDVAQLDDFFFHVLRANLESKVAVDFKTIVQVAGHYILNRQNAARAFNIADRHYNLGNDLYEAMLDKRLTYTCGYWKNASTLDDAQEAKLDLVCRKLNLQAGQTVLDIGCGWGSFMKFAAEKYRVRCVGVTVSKEQIALGEKLCAGLPIEFQLKDYRDLTGKFDHIISLGMFEHVGYKNYRTYLEVAARCLKDEGLFLLHTIGYPESTHAGEPWTRRYIFPDCVIPSVAQISRAAEKLFLIEDWHNFGADYDKTLMAWFTNFNAHRETLRAANPGQYTDRFYRMWKYYLLSCAGSFRARKLQLWQIVLSKNGVLGGYQSIR